MELKLTLYRQVYNHDFLEINSRVFHEQKMHPIIRLSQVINLLNESESQMGAPLSPLKVCFHVHVLVKTGRIIWQHIGCYFNRSNHTLNLWCLIKTILSSWGRIFKKWALRLKRQLQCVSYEALLWIHYNGLLWHDWMKTL